ncbi:triose-phosphate isomerase [Arthrobacter sp. APC 3897]|uniref:triose-phosphate isomerase n=1 Tax=Arthrobacter sp. APC 3897 TaxID=3035204 RepID=UPI0025B3E735|nr:triose-phosphate isomerase [Arthrobacter sp. APC 3897]MDN3480693.1 triose-phosphate isomerase [Arthrobacter sp. APC 3897]
MTVWIGTSWKMNKTVSEAQRYTRTLLAGLDGRELGTVQPFIIPPATALSAVAGILAGDRRVLLGAQNAHWEDDGAWTGEVSVPQVADAGARLVEIGHSERREHFGENDETVRLKVAAVLRHGLTPLLCIGESAEVKDAGRSPEFIVGQASRALEGLSGEELARVLIAYEPVWAIGAAGRPAGPRELAEPFSALADSWGHRVAGLLYGGSVAPENAAALLEIPHVNGLFIGRAAWQAQGYLTLLDIAANTINQELRTS